MFNRHRRFFQGSLFGRLPSRHESLDTTRTTLAHLLLSGLGSINSISVLTDEQKEGITNWIMLHYVKSSESTYQGSPEENIPVCGFSAEVGSLDITLASTYSSLAVLSILHPEKELNQFVDTAAIAQSLKYFQNPNGSFRACISPSDSDVRLNFCACACARFCGNDFGQIDINQLEQYLVGLQNYDGGFSGANASESHAGNTFCAVMSLEILGKIDSIPDKDGLIRFLVNRQQYENGGFNGRPNKLEDVCYTWWIGSILKIFGIESFISSSYMIGFLSQCYDVFHGGVKKDQTCDHADPLHAGLGLLGESIFIDTFLDELDEHIDRMEIKEKFAKIHSDSLSDKDHLQPTKAPCTHACNCDHHEEQAALRIPAGDWIIADPEIKHSESFVNTYGPNPLTEEFMHDVTVSFSTDRRFANVQTWEVAAEADIFTNCDPRLVIPRPKSDPASAEIAEKNEKRMKRIQETCKAVQKRDAKFRTERALYQKKLQVELAMEKVSMEEAKRRNEEEDPVPPTEERNQGQDITDEPT
ncbi:putative Geranylgeranyl transferase type-1 subunit beta [Blattamonas nauphoetae]|uniref:Geranylgeranyl transferase type II subunit beta n=1 Tax=Blattamonas nauphoetae TaxID=2049346 RepID=A0ABQ9YKR1_9EUKA|nr:putative Geranylgeranyl transferase type-1 subunit beta [Blattamonas nauphoetae]